MDAAHRGLTVVATSTWTADGALPDVAVDFDARRRVVAVRPRETRDPTPLPGLLVPGLTNAHAHTELYGLPDVGRGAGLAAWFAELGRARREGRADAAAGARALYDAGTAVVSDVSNGGDTGPALAAAGLAGVVQHELVGHDHRVGPALDVAARGVRFDGLPVRPTAHGPHSTSPRVLSAVAAVGGPLRASVHVAEDADELAMLRGAGPLLALLRGWGVDLSAFTAPHQHPIDVLAAHGPWGRDLLAVHAVLLRPEDPARLAAAGVAVCLCPRSNLAISGRLPDVSALVDAGVALALGTDGTVSAPDVDVLAEIPVLARAFPQIPVERWLEAALAGAALLGLPGYGRLAVGDAPGALLLEDVRTPSDLADGPPRRRWLVPPGSPP